ncbi:MAG: PD-(D/E)XK nuclease family protein [Firmicutes bacterium]|nr:PD-(D/E)XK nuclease family protein [Bacillota bacterium]
MLNIYYGRESIDKEKFIYERIAEKQGRTLVIVPDQYTLEAEKRAFRLLHTQGLLDVEIISMSRLGSRLLAQQGGNRKTFIDKYGRHMILTRIAKECKEDLQVFGSTMEKPSFLEMTNNFISEMKQYEVTPWDLEIMRGNLEEGSLLHRKLADLQFIYEKYEEVIEGKYTDAEDLISLYTEKISQSPAIADSEIWVYGFDSFAPKALSVLGNLMAAAKDFHIFLTCDDNCIDEELFQLPRIVMRKLQAQADTFGVQCRIQNVGVGFETIDRAPALAAIERQLYGACISPEEDYRGLTIVEAASIYGEAESAAAHVLHLVRDKGYRYRDIVIICNDPKTRGSVLRRIFEEYGMEIFDDQKRSIASSPIAIYVVALLETVMERYRTADLLKVLKSGFTNLAPEEIEDLENYVFKYRVKGTMWKKPFVKGALEYGIDGLERLNQLRENVIAVFTRVETLTKEVKTTREFIESYYDYLVNQVGLEVYISNLIAMQEEQGNLDLAEETKQIWGKIVALFDQMMELSGEEPFHGKDFLLLLTAGLSQMEVGILPPTSDDLMLGTMQRTRSGEAKAVLVIGANEGLLPKDADTEGLFSLDELEYLAGDEEGKALCKSDHIRVMEEQLAIYRNLCKPTESLWISYAVSDEEGRELRTSEIVDRLLRMFPGLTPEKDVLNRGDTENLLGGKVNTLRHLTKALQEGEKGETVEPLWKSVLDWFQREEKGIVERVLAGLDFKNQQPDLPQDLVELLYKRSEGETLTISPSRLERFSRCPFAHFVNYGLKPEERRVFEAASREIGDIYHQCLMELSEKLTQEGRWETVTEEECRGFVEDVATREASQYREGLFQMGNEEKYKLSRIAETCFHVCWALIEQVRSGEIIESRYEEPFGKKHKLSPITVDCGSQMVQIEGIIDRFDTLQDDRVKIIDYKTGREFFDIKEARGGYRLQLMLYLRAAQEQKRKPAGVFYFLIDEPRIDLSDIEKEKVFEKISKEMKKSFRLNGIMVEDTAVIRSIAGEFDGYSDILPLRNTKEGIKATSENFLLSEENFQKLQAEMDQQIEKLCRELVSGKITIQPKKTEKTSPCVYCQFKSICRFDTAFEGCNYEVIS